MFVCFFAGHGISYSIISLTPGFIYTFSLTPLSLSHFCMSLSFATHTSLTVFFSSPFLYLFFFSLPTKRTKKTRTRVLQNGRSLSSFVILWPSRNAGTNDDKKEWRLDSLELNATPFFYFFIFFFFLLSRDKRWGGKGRSCSKGSKTAWDHRFVFHLDGEREEGKKKRKKKRKKRSTSKTNNYRQRKSGESSVFRLEVSFVEFTKEDIIRYILVTSTPYRKSTANCRELICNHTRSVERMAKSKVTKKL